MALIKCKECDGQVSDLASACPRCGAPMEPPIKLSAATAASAASKASPGMPMWFKLFGIAILLMALFSCIGSGRNQSDDMPMAQRYPGPWMSDFNLQITQALVKHGATGCGEFKYRESSMNRGEFLVHCTRDGVNSTAYLVWAGTGSVTGPHQVATGL
ncbi:hypothetical protein [Polaromonas sp. OV174]|uniref:hypothetical protein n=1 Tax=Polaromonas sp. OV174 TaxID=1855300 RepID=UPI000B85FB6D|nr:hypothetical protein [Polaromonas sp. OV174]